MEPRKKISELQVSFVGAADPLHRATWPLTVAYQPPPRSPRVAAGALQRTLSQLTTARSITQFSARLDVVAAAVMHVATKSLNHKNHRRLFTRMTAEAT